MPVVPTGVHDIAGLVTTPDRLDLSAAPSRVPTGLITSKRLLPGGPSSAATSDDLDKITRPCCSSGSPLRCAAASARWLSGSLWTPSPSVTVTEARRGRVMERSGPTALGCLRCRSTPSSLHLWRSPCRRLSARVSSSSGARGASGGRECDDDGMPPLSSRPSPTGLFASPSDDERSSR